MGKGAERRKKQKARHDYEFHVRPGLVAKALRYNGNGTIIDPLLDGLATDLRAIDARMLDPKNTKLTDKVATRPPTVYYVIIGRGPAATCNHATLLLSKWGREERLKDRPVMHIGFEDPWTKYHPHGMGQPPHLLRFPGFHAYPGKEGKRLKTERGNRLLSTDFAECIEDEWTQIEEKYGQRMAVVDGCAMYIQQKKAAPDAKFIKDVNDIEMGVGSKLNTLLTSDYPPSLTTTEAPFRIAVMFPNGKAGLVYASHIDICSGAGRASLLKSDAMKDIDKARPPPWIPAETYFAAPDRLKVMTGTEALLESIPWDPDHRYACYGPGGIGLNMVERAEDEGIRLDWFNRGSLLQNGLALRGNVAVLRDGTKPSEENAIDPASVLAGKIAKATGPKVDPSEKEAIEKDLRTFGKTIRFIRMAELTKVNLAPGDVPPMILKFASTAKTVVTDYWGAKGPSPSGAAENAPGEYFPYSDAYMAANEVTADEAKAYDRLIITIGQDNLSPGTPASVMGHLSPKAVLANGIKVAVCAGENDAVRLLGAAAQMFGGGELMEYAKDTTDTGKYFATLPESSVPPGFIYSGINIARANKYFTADKPNPNINTMLASELTEALTKLSVPKVDEVVPHLLLRRSTATDGYARTGYATLDSVWEEIRIALKLPSLDPLKTAIEKNAEKKILLATYSDADPYP